MPHATPLIATLVAGICLAFLAGLVAHRFRLPPIAGYLLAGVCIGPFTPGFVADQKLANELAEIGVILLMFGVGLHFSPKDLMQVRKVAIPGALVQIASATIMGWALGRFALGMSDVEGLLMG
ncbi:MAG: cation:proton antiporter, partial [Rhizobiales bacterium]|nr:cation:proton antiporter [Hyphomicrobiales bacterium]